MQAFVVIAYSNKHSLFDMGEFLSAWVCTTEKSLKSKLHLQLGFGETAPTDLVNLHDGWQASHKIDAANET